MGGYVGDHPVLSAQGVRLVLPQCRKCGTCLAVGVNWWPSDEKEGRSICKNCHYLRNRKWEERNRDRSRRYKRQYVRMHYVERSDGTLIRLDKKPYLGICELCGDRYETNMVYHHWNDESPDDGMWICRRCHRFVHSAIKHPHLLENLRRALEAHRIPTLEITLA